MLKNRWAQLTWAILVTAMVSSSTGQVSDEQKLGDSNDPQRLEIIHALTLALQDDETKNSNVDAMKKALEFLQRNQSPDARKSSDAFWTTKKALEFLQQNQIDQAQRWENFRTDWKTDFSMDDYAKVNEVHSFLADQQEPSRYWIGVQTEASGEYIANVQDNQTIVGKGGLLITAVTAGGPADEAGLKVNDVILRFNDAPTDELGQLVAAIESNQDASAKLFLVRDKSFVTIELTPRLRDPKPDSNQDSRRTILADAWVEIYGKALAEDVEATIHLNRDGVTEIYFHQGDQTDSAKSDQLDDLPVVYRGFAKTLVKNIEDTIKTNVQREALSTYLYQWKPHLQPRNFQYNWSFETPKTQNSDHDRLGKIEQQLKELTQAIHELKKD